MEDNLMLIGEIAEFFGVSRKAIRLYEKKGIIKPVKIDEKNGYRYYSTEQIQQLNALLELKAMGFSLEEIKHILEGELTKQDILSALNKKKIAWQESISLAENKMDSIEQIVNRLEQSKSADKIQELTEKERAWLLVKMVCVEDIRGQSILSEALWL